MNTFEKQDVNRRIQKLQEKYGDLPHWASLAAEMRLSSALVGVVETSSSTAVKLHWRDMISWWGC